ncbi:hypothetical protein OS493_025222 [Desmophyllum pertusum]|uniref:Uncharacterized protein n=1 Tax=Desmophyllum pertusum TaxID=174260 RepID=A0A9X0D1Y2_9CNID|nr:hypothetical protein OS493_025222 [Desmophyllum pertusum]
MHEFRPHWINSLATIPQKKKPFNTSSIVIVILFRCEKFKSNDETLQSATLGLSAFTCFIIGIKAFFYES